VCSICRQSLLQFSHSLCNEASTIIITKF
jgi:hypothetical protein